MRRAWSKESLPAGSAERRGMSKETGTSSEELRCVKAVGETAVGVSGRWGWRIVAGKVCSVLPEERLRRWPCLEDTELATSEGGESVSRTSVPQLAQQRSADRGTSRMGDKAPGVLAARGCVVMDRGAGFSLSTAANERDVAKVGEASGEWLDGDKVILSPLFLGGLGKRA